MHTNLKTVALAGLISLGATVAEAQQVVRGLVVCDTKEQIIEVLQGWKENKDLKEILESINAKENKMACGQVNTTVLGVQPTGDTVENGGEVATVYELQLLLEGKLQSQFSWGIENKKEKGINI